MGLAPLKLVDGGVGMGNHQGVLGDCISRNTRQTQFRHTSHDEGYCDSDNGSNHDICNDGNKDGCYRHNAPFNGVH